MPISRNLIVSCSSLLWLASACADTTTVGMTYDISEPDILEEIQTKASKVDWNKAMKRAPSTWSAWSSAKLPAAQKNSERHYKPIYTTEFDVPDKNGTVIYPKGYQFNPLEYVTIPGRIVVISGDESQVDWIKKSKRDGDIILTAGGDPLKLGKEIGQPVYLLDDKGAERLGVAAVPSMVVQNGQELVVKEIHVKPK